MSRKLWNTSKVPQNPASAHPTLLAGSYERSLSRCTQPSYRSGWNEQGEDTKTTHSEKEFVLRKEIRDYWETDGW